MRIKSIQSTWIASEQKSSVLIEWSHTEDATHATIDLWWVPTEPQYVVVECCRPMTQEEMFSGKKHTCEAWRPRPMPKLGIYRGEQR